MSSQFKIISFDSIDSTNEEAKRRIKSSDISDRVLITSKVQTSGKGRYSKGWVSADGNMFATIVIRIDIVNPLYKHTQEMLSSPEFSKKILGRSHEITLEFDKSNSGNDGTIIKGKCYTSLNDAALYSFLTAISVGESIKDFVSDDVAVKYKWPNDVMLDGKKLSGILLETLKDSNGCNWLIIGTGVNINNQPEDIDKQVTSLMKYSLEAVSVESFLAKFIQHFQTQEKLWKNAGFACIRSAWLESAYRLGDEITVNLKNKVLKGKFEGISHRGELEVLVDGEKLLICGGEVFFGE
jgi:BirA family biotin operon repressor/biotin-[acetyl-CoA-carboxylase] ligase